MRSTCKDASVSVRTWHNAPDAQVLVTLYDGEGKTVAQGDPGELTIQKGSSNAAARCLRSQAELILLPYVRDGFAFLGV